MMTRRNEKLSYRWCIRFSPMVCEHEVSAYISATNPSRYNIDRLYTIPTDYPGGRRQIVSYNFLGLIPQKM